MPDFHHRMRPVLGRITLLALLWTGSALAQQTGSCLPAEDGSNPCPVPLRRPDVHPLSQMAEIGKQIFHDPLISGSGRLSCASCHEPGNHYASSAATPVFLGGAHLDLQGRRSIPTLTYVERNPNFSIGPDNPTSEAAPAIVANAASTQRGGKNAANPGAASANMVPQGGLFWDGRADTLQEQALGPLYDPAEMASTPEKVTERVIHAPYSDTLKQLAGAGANASSSLLLAEAIFAMARYQIEDPAFHRYNSKFDGWLEGHEKFSPLEREGYLAFNDPAKGNCAACHVDTVASTRLPPLFTDHQYEALGAPRNMALKANHNPSSYDLGVCDRQPDGRTALSLYCGMFTTPTLRNVATRKVFFHNGVFRSLEDVLDFYALRDLEPKRFYPVSKTGHVEAYNDLPAQYRANLDTTDAPFDRKPGEQPAMTPHDREAIIAFLKTLTDR
ncbi:cytochrome-c peroxidase [Gluconobacter kondonii]|uniref:cytochrome-c peroxidase n=1 Tax=Gluconobacter kondonii TaxID=941463 RepID=UPI001F121285|nr:cytochrome c peroxidase [Gluconobacter kondonii]